jgi:hypothetical protein
MAYSRDSVMAYLQAAERERARIRQAIVEAQARTARARGRVGRLGVLRTESGHWSDPDPTNGLRPAPVGSTPVAASPTAPVPITPGAGVAPFPVAPVPAGASPVPDQTPDLWVRPVPDGPTDPFPYRSVRPMPVPDTREAVAALPTSSADDPTLPWHLAGPMERVAGD